MIYDDTIVALLDEPLNTSSHEVVYHGPWFKADAGVNLPSSVFWLVFAQIPRHG